ncbi:MAG: GntR family transcriptional regulator, partial [Pseudonocardia sp.]|nr:GntR family transcriptional regulator [Pseudonocardia sp.]
MSIPDVALDRSSPVPLYYQVATRMEQLIDDGELAVGARLENEIDLADRLGVSRPTMRRAIQYLVERGLLVRKRGIGTRVVHPKVRRPVELTSLWDDLVRSEQRPHTEVRRFAVETISAHVAQELGLPADIQVTRFERVRYAGGEPLALMTNVVPVDVLSIDRADLTDHGLYQLLRAAGRVPRMANQVIGARAATGAEARLLGEAPGAPVLTMTRTAWDAEGVAVEYGSHIYRASRYTFELT